MEQLLLQSLSKAMTVYATVSRHVTGVHPLRNCVVTELLVVGFWPVLYIPNKQIINT